MSERYRIVRVMVGVRRQMSYSNREGPDIHGGKEHLVTGVCGCFQNFGGAN